MTKITYPLVLDTIGKLKATGSGLSVHCSKCNNNTRLDMDKLIERLGEDHSCMHDDLFPLFYCKRCRDARRPDKHISFTHVANSEPQGGNLYMKAKGG